MSTKQKHKGLSTSEVNKQRKKHGYNEIPPKKEYKILKIILSQFTSFLVIILIISGIISIAIGELIDGIAIIAIVVINAIIGFIQEYKAENAVAKLKKMVVSKAVVIRNGETISLPVRELVPQDIVVLSEGEKIPADLELIEAFSLKVDESMLTGESISVEKNEKGESREKFLFRGTLITSGRALAKVIAIGKNTEFGKIINLLEQDNEEKSPLTLQLDELGRRIGISVLILAVVLFGLGYLRGISIFDMMMTSIALGVSAIPEGLPIIVTLTLAMGVQVLARRKAIVRKMNSIETLGATTIICSDKTGTLTLNEMTASVIKTSAGEVKIPGLGYDIKEKVKLKSEEEKILLEISENCNNSVYGKNILGDPTEIALKVLTRKADYSKEYEKIDEKVFTSERKLMSTYHKAGKEKRTYTKGAYEEVLKRSKFILRNGKVEKLTEKDKNEIEKSALEYAKKALRVLAFAYRTGEFREEELIFIGLVGIIDPPRKTVPASIATARNAGIKIKIITGDNAITAKAVGEEIGLKDAQIITGEEIDKLSDSKLYKAIEKNQIFARTTPQHKYRIVDLLQKNHEVVAVTGDGVNDAPALKHADVGVAMGIKGTEATQEVADIILKDDNFSTIITTIKEGRRIYHNILAFIKFMLSANFITLVVVAIITIAGYPLPILALQVLFLNVATDALPALALGQSKASPGIMEENPHPKKENIFLKFLGFITAALILQIVANLIVYRYGLFLDQAAGINTNDLEIASHSRTLVFTQTVLFELFFAFVCKEEKSVTLRSFLSNKFLIGAVLISLVFQLVILYVPFMQEIFKTVPLDFKQWALVVICASTAFFVPKFTDLLRIIFRRKQSHAL